MKRQKAAHLLCWNERPTRLLVFQEGEEFVGGTSGRVAIAGSDRETKRDHQSILGGLDLGVRLEHDQGSRETRLLTGDKNLD